MIMQQTGRPMFRGPRSHPVLSQLVAKRQNRRDGIAAPVSFYVGLDGGLLSTRTTIERSARSSPSLLGCLGLSHPGFFCAARLVSPAVVSRTNQQAVVRL
jgi:hypothetical protein